MSAVGQHVGVTPTGLTVLQKERIEVRLRHGLQSTGVPGAVLGIAIGDESWTTCSGKLSVKEAAPVNSETRFMLGSVQKVLTAAMVMQLVDEGELALDTTLSSAFPGVEAVDGRFLSVTVRQLLNHSSGIDGDLMVDFDGPDRLANYVFAAASQRLLHEPGRMFSYSNAGYAVLGAILENRLGTPFGAAAAEMFAACTEGTIQFGTVRPADAASGHRRNGDVVEDTNDRLPGTLEPAEARPM